MALDWMMAEAERCGLRFIPGNRESIRTHQDIHGTLSVPRRLAVYYRWGPRNIARPLSGIIIFKFREIHVSVFRERIANGTGWYAPGNIPFACEVVTTPSLAATGTATSPDQSVLQAMRQAIIHPSLPEGRSLLDTVTRASRSGKLAYHTFLGSTLLLLWWLWDPPWSWNRSPARWIHESWWWD